MVVHVSMAAKRPKFCVLFPVTWKKISFIPSQSLTLFQVTAIF